MKKRTMEILNRMDSEYGRDIPCYLNHDDGWQLLIATIMSAQCTDARVNMVTETLFKKYPSIEAFANASLPELENDIHSVGFYHNKAKNIIECCKRLHEVYRDELPKDIDNLTTLAGVGRKTANVIRGNIFCDPSIVVDTHVLRVSNRLKFVETKDPVKCEFLLMKEIPKDYWILINKWFIAFGRKTCKAQNPDCGNCYLKEYCKEYNNGTNSVR